MVLGNNGNLFNYFVRVATSTEEQNSQSSSSEVTMEPLRTPLLHSPGEGLLFTADADVSTAKEDGRSMKRKHTFALNFATDIESQTGLKLLPAPERKGRSISQCGTCLTADPKRVTFKHNVKAMWIRHAKTCPGLKKLIPPTLSAQAQNMVMHMTLGGDKHRKNTVDAYVTAYWVYKHKLAFTTGDKLREVRTALRLLCSSMYDYAYNFAYFAVITMYELRW